MQDMAIIIAFVGIIIFAAHLFEEIYRRTMIPDVLIFIIIGLLIGPLLNITSPTHFGIVGPVFTTITFIVILFEAGLNLNISAISRAFRESLILSISTIVTTIILVSTAAFFLTDLGILKSLMLGSIVGAISPAVAAPLISNLNMKIKSQSVLILESTVTDVLSIVLTVSLLELYVSDKLEIGFMLGKIIASFVLATVIGLLGAIGWSIILNKVRTLQNSTFSTGAFVFVIFGIAEWFGYSGAIGALVFGITLGNINLVKLPQIKWLNGNFSLNPISLNRTEKSFYSELVFLLKTFFFIYMGISLRLADLNVIWIAMALTALIFMVRPPIVRLVVDKKTTVTDASIMSVMVPRGLAAAVLASLPFQRGIEGGELMQNIAYGIILFTIVVTSVLVFLIEKTGVAKFYSFIFSGYAVPDSNPKTDTPE